MDVAPLQTLEVRIHHIIISHTTWSDLTGATIHNINNYIHMHNIYIHIILYVLPV